MKTQDPIRLQAGFYPDWWHKEYGISFDRKYYFDPETRIEARMAMDKALYERFGDVGMGDPNPKPKPMIFPENFAFIFIGCSSGSIPQPNLDKAPLIPVRRTIFTPNEKKQWRGRVPRSGGDPRQGI